MTIGEPSDETHDLLLGGRVAIGQPESGFRVAVDSVLLAAAVSPMPGERVLDVGCGDGGATLCLAWREPEVRVHGIDVRADALERFAANVERNGWSGRVTGARHDVGEGPGAELTEAFDWVMSNPPYLPAERMDLRATSGDPDPATTETVPLRSWAAFMTGCLRFKGRLAIIHRADRIDTLLAALEPLVGGMEICPIRPRAGDSAKRVLVVARKGARTPARLLGGLVLHDATGAYTPAARGILENGERLVLD